MNITHRKSLAERLGDLARENRELEAELVSMRSRLDQVKLLRGAMEGRAKDREIPFERRQGYAYVAQELTLILKGEA